MTRGRALKDTKPEARIFHEFIGTIFFMHEGPFKGRDPFELCREEFTFWREYLDAIDNG